MADKSYKRLLDCNEETTLKLMSTKTCLIESQEEKVLRRLGSVALNDIAFYKHPLKSPDKPTQHLQKKTFNEEQKQPLNDTNS